MRSCLSSLVVLLAASVPLIADAQSAVTPGGWPRSMPLPPTAASGATSTVIHQAPTPSLSAEEVAKRFQVAGNEVYDRKADLTWQRCDFGQTWDEANAWCHGVKRHGTVDALTEAAKSEAAGWRLPTLDELSSMMEVACRTQAKDTTPLFPEIERGAGMTYYLTSTPNGSGEGIMAQQCIGGSLLMPAGLGRKYTSVTHLVHSGAIATR